MNIITSRVRIFHLLLSFLLMPVIIYSQELVFEHYTTDNGLSASIVRTVIQDKTGFLWFGTHSGLDRYDGNVFKSYKNIPGDTSSITNGFVQCLLEDKAGNLWIGTTNGLDKLDRKTEKFIHYKPFTGKSENEWNNNIFSICEDHSGFLWLGTGDGLNMFDPTTGIFKHFRHDKSDPKSLRHNFISSVLETSKGSLWIGTGNGLEKYDRETGAFIHYYNDNVDREGFYSDWIQNKNRINTIYEDNDGILWIGTQDGLLEIDPESNNFTHYFYDPADISSISFYAVTSVCEENEDALWIGTYNGLNLFNKKTKKFRRFYHDENDPASLPNNSIASVTRERSGTLWVTTYAAGVSKVNRTTYPFKQYSIQSWKKIKKFSSAYIMDVNQSANGSLWIATPVGLLLFDPTTESYKNHVFTQNIRMVKEDRSGNLWVAFNNSSGRGLFKSEKNGRLVPITDSTGSKFPWIINKVIEGRDSTMWLCSGENGGIARVNMVSNKYTIVFESEVTINDIHQDEEGLIWAGTRENGLLCFDPSTNKITKHFRSNPGDHASISGNSVLTIYEDKNKNLWLGTNIGLNKFDRNTGSFYHYTEENGLPHNWVYLIFEDSRNDLWVNTLKGISKFDPQSNTFKNYDVLHGIAVWDRSGIGCKTEEGEIYLVSPAGLTRFHPDSIRDNPYEPPVVITKITVSGNTIPFSDTLSLTADDNSISFEFAALSYIRPEKNLYAYRLDDVDDEWVNSGNKRYASYTNLDPGEYIFLVKGSNNDGVWNETPAAVKIIIHPPWWKTWWAYALYLSLIISVLFFTWKLQLIRIKNRHEYEMSRFEAKKLHQLDHIKTTFFTNISHEFRTPLTLILGPAKQLLEKSRDESTKIHADLIHRSAKKLNHLVNEMLDILRIEAGEMKLRACAVNLVSIVKEIVFSFYPMAERKKITFNLNSEEKEIIIYIDREKFDKILNNVLSNAFKFTPEGGRIEITINLRLSKSSPGTAEISVRDTGVGIPADSLEKIFDRFYQVDSSYTREQGGTGIGLSLTKELIELHNGKIEVESVAGKGSTFRLIFPLGKGHLKPENICDEEQETVLKNEDIASGTDDTFARKEYPEENALFSKTELPSLLIVEDNPDLKKYIGMILENQYQIFEAGDGEEGVSKSFEIIPDLIISDIMMPKMDGFQLCNKLKTDSRTSHIPLIMLTAKATLKDKINGLQTGADDYIMKPFEAEELKARIRNLLEQRKRLHEHFHSYGLVDIEDKSITSIDRLFLQNAFCEINNHIPDSTYSVELLAENLGVSRSLLFKKINSLIGETPGEFIKRIRLNKAALLLGKNKGNISEIALEVGFSNPSYFAECFKKQFGVSPSHYQNNSMEDGMKNL